MRNIILASAILWLVQSPALAREGAPRTLPVSKGLSGVKEKVIGKAVETPMEGGKRIDYYRYDKGSGSLVLKATTVRRTLGDGAKVNHAHWYKPEGSRASALDYLQARVLGRGDISLRQSLRSQLFGTDYATTTTVKANGQKTVDQNLRLQDARARRIKRDGKTQTDVLKSKNGNTVKFDLD